MSWNGLGIQTILVLEYKKRNDCKILHSSTKLIASDSDIDNASKNFDKNKKLGNIGLFWMQL